MKLYWMRATMVVTLALCSICQAAADTTSIDKPKPAQTGKTKTAEKLIQQYLPQLNFTIPARCSTRIKRLILREVIRGRHEMEATLGRAQLYFPIFEYHLKKYDLPDELKYIPFVESRLKIRAQSDMKAAGLWQFMPYTAKRYKLRITESIDERFDPIKSTDAAARLLRDLNEEFGDWLLALAAYNCGSGRVQRAIRKGKSKDYWKIAQYLPKQTQHYIPAFIANVYIGNYYTKHNLQPKTHQFHFENVKIIKLQDVVRLSDIAKAGGYSLKQLRMLNPCYMQGIVPASQRGNYLMVPASSMLQVQEYIHKTGKNQTREIFLKPKPPTAMLDTPMLRFQDVVASRTTEHSWLCVMELDFASLQTRRS